MVTTSSIHLWAWWTLLQFVHVNGYCSLLLCSSNFRLFCKEHLCCTTLSEIVLSTDMNNFKGVGGGEGAEGGRNYCCWKLCILLSKLKTYTKKSHYIFNNLQKYQEDSLSVLVKYQSASLVRQLLQTKDKFPLQNHYIMLQHNSIKNSTCLFLGLVFTKPVVSHISFFCKNKQGKADNRSIFKVYLRAGKRK